MRALTSPWAETLLLAGLLFLGCGFLQAQTPPSDPANGQQTPLVWETRPRVITLFAAGSVYRYTLPTCIAPRMHS